jgi:hypothetical protein
MIQELDLELGQARTTMAQVYTFKFIFTLRTSPVITSYQKNDLTFDMCFQLLLKLTSAPLLDPLIFTCHC